MFATLINLLHHDGVRRALGLGMFFLAVAAICLIALAPDSLWAVPAVNTAADALKKLPRTLRETGLYAPGTSKMVREGIASFSPQYALWSDGAE